MEYRTNKKLKLIAPVVGLSLLLGCSESKPTTPALTPELAHQLLNYDERAQNFLTHVKKQNPGCEFLFPLPDQVPPLTQIDLGHIVRCQGNPAPLEFDASATFIWDAVAGKWVLKRFSS